MNILFICTGNTCRSPMAEALLRDKYPQINVRSAGVFAADGAGANENALKALEEKNITFDHRSQPVTDELLDWADLVLTMTMQHKRLLIMEHPNHQEKYFVLKEYVSAPNEHKVQQLQMNIENKRRQFIADHPELEQEELEEKLAKLVKEDEAKLRQYMAEITDVDISDPFGGDLHLYRATRMELEKQIEKLMKKIEATRKE